MRRYLNWPVIIDADGTGTNLYPFFLNRVTNEQSGDGSRVFGDIQVYLRDGHDGNVDADLSEVTVVWNSLVALVNRRTVDGAEFPAVGEEPTISYEAMEEEVHRLLRITRHEITDTVRSPDDTVLIQSQEIVEGMLSIQGAVDLVIGADVNVPKGSGTLIPLTYSVFQLARVRRVDTYRAEIRLERTID